MALDGTKLSDIKLQKRLISGTNIKTINNQSILGPGNIDIQGGGGAEVPVILTATDNIIIGQVAVSVDYTGTFVNAFAIDGSSNIVDLDISVFSNYVRFELGEALLETIECVVVYADNASTNGEEVRY